MRKTERNFELAAKVAQMNDEMLVGPEEVAAFLGVSPVSVRTGKIKTPRRVVGLTRRMQWRLGDVRAFARALQTQPRKGPGAPTKKEKVEGRRS